MQKFFIDFEFETSIQTVYWFPLAIFAEDMSVAQEVAKKFHAGLSEKYQVKSFSGPVPIVTELNFESVEKYRTARSRGKVVALNVMEYSIREIQLDANLDFDEELEFELLESPAPFEQTIATVRQAKFPVRVIRHNEFGLNNELLIINIVAPNDAKE